MAAPAASISRLPGHAEQVQQQPDWKRVAYLLHASRALDDIEESKLLPERKVLYQFSGNVLHQPAALAVGALALVELFFALVG